MSHPQPLNPDLLPLRAEILLDHAESVRSLARGLLREEHSAEDVVQETWVRALERPPQRRDGLRGWLASVARSTALNRLRSDQRRVRREHSASRSEALASTDEVVERGQVLRSVVDAVMQLDEPYRSVVLLRYYEDRPPREIAALRGVPVATVKSQLHRALELLRGRLDADVEGGRRHWVSALALVTGGSRIVPLGPEPSSGPGVASAGKGNAMIGKLALGLGVSLVGVVSVGSWLLFSPTEFEGERELALSLPGSAAEAPPVSAQQEAGLASVGEAGRAPLALEPEAVSEAAVSTASAHAGAFVVRGSVVDSLDRPLSGAAVYLAPPEHPLNKLGETDPDGNFEITFAGQSPSLELVAWVTHRGTSSGLTRLSVENGKPTNVHVALNPFAPRSDDLEASIPSRQVVAGSVKLSEEREQLREIQPNFAATKGFTVRGSIRPFADPLRYAPVVDSDPSGAKRFQWFPSDVLLGVLREKEVAARSERIRVLEVAQLDALMKYKDYQVATMERAQSVVAGLVETEENAGPARRLTGTVTDEHGAPVPHAPILVFDDAGAFSFKAGEQGEFELEARMTALTILAGGGSFGRATTQVPEQGDFAWNARLDRGLEVQGQLVGAEGEPLANWRVEFVQAGPAAFATDVTHTDADGNFAIPNLPRGQGRLFVSDASTPVTLASHVLDAVSPGGPELLFEIDNSATGRLTLSVNGAGGAVQGDADVRLWQVDSGRAIWLQAGEGGEYSAQVPAGSYRIAAGSRESGWMDLGVHWVQSGGATELGSFTLPAAGSLIGPGPAQPWTLQRRGPVFTTVFAQGAAGEELDVILPSGSYELLVFGEELTRHEVLIPAGGEFALDL